MRHAASKGKADSNHGAIAEAIEALGYPVMDLHAAGGGVEDLLVGLSKTLRVPARGGVLINMGDTFPRSKWWLLVECKVSRYKPTASTAVRYTKAQIEWRKQTEGWPRITVVSAQDAVDQIRGLTG